jgi:hypothetical protein
MTKIKPNEQCLCLSGKKYKKCCQTKDIINKNLQLDEINKLEKIYLNGQEEHSNKINYCLKYYSELFPNCKIIDLSSYITNINYKQILTLNYYKNTIIIIEKNNINEELFYEKSPLMQNDILFIYKGSYKTFEAIDILKYDKDIKKMIENRDKGLTI